MNSSGRPGDADQTSARDEERTPRVGEPESGTARDEESPEADERSTDQGKSSGGRTDRGEPRAE
jgi:hypothetical protein